MPNRDQITRSFETIMQAITEYGDEFEPAEVAETLADKARSAVLLRVEQFAGRDVPHSELYAFIASDILVAIGNIHRGSKLAFDMMHTPKSSVWADEARAKQKPRHFFLTRDRAVVGNELISRRDLAWSYQTTPGSTFEKVVRAVTDLVPLAVADALRSLR